VIEGGDRVAEVERQLERRLGFVPEPVAAHERDHRKGLSRLLPEALRLHDDLDVEVGTAELNRALEEATTRNVPPLRGKRRARFFYATQTAKRPLTVLVFMNDPSLIAPNYHRYLEGFFRKRFGVRSAPVRVRLRGRAERSDDAAGEESAGPDEKTR
jgi:GTP-binding protein